MGDVVNLNRFRKQKAKVERQKQAEVNRRLHGRTKAERAREELQKRRLTRAVDGAKLDPPADGDPAEDELVDGVLVDGVLVDGGPADNEG
jgi:hypothetical protein